MAPFAKVGGLADVTHGLSKKLQEKGENNLVILPKYSFIPAFKNTKEEIFSSFFENKWVKNRALSFSFESVPILLIEPLEVSFFSEKSLYTQEDLVKFLYFCRACLDYLAQKKASFDILHLHDWHTAFCSFLVKTLFLTASFSIKKTILTIHNLLYQGVTPFRFVQKIGVLPKQEKALFPSPSSSRSSQVNLLKMGIIHADWVTTVSPNYAQEILTAEKGCGLHPLLTQKKQSLSGILNGLDETAWNPEKDAALAFPFSSKEPLENLLKKKRKNRDFLEKKLKLNRKKGPLVIAVCRLVEQKGPELLAYGIRKSVESGATALLLGSHPGKSELTLFKTLQKNLEKGSFHFHFFYDDALARLSFAAADFLLIPSRFEPCGLTQFIAMRYATLPIARKTGGLADTIFDADDPNIPEKKKNGYLFEEYEETSLDKTLERALCLWYENPKKRRLLIKQALSFDSSWEKAAGQYQKLYQRLLN